MAQIVLTGINRGIGLQLAKKFQSENHQVYGMCRQASDELKQTKIPFVEGIDVCDVDSISKAKETMGLNKIDILINVAGILTSETLEDMNFDRITKQFEVNTLGPLKVTECFLSLMEENSKIIMITSRMGSITDNTSGRSYGYRISKAALNAASKSLAEDLKKQNIAVGILHPGWVQTEMTGNSGPLTAVDSANLLYQRIQEVNMNTTGKFYHANGEELPW